MLIQQCQYEEQGLGFTRQVALMLAELSAILKKNKENIVGQINIKVSVGIQILPEIAKLNALQILCENVIKCYFPSCSKLPKITGFTSNRYYTSGEPELNLIRQSLQCFAFEVANIKNIEISAFNGEEKSQRISQNIIALLEEESKFKEIKNSFAGAHHIEKLSDDFAKESWKIFQEIENMGGYETAVNNGTIDSWIKEDNTKEIALFSSKEKALVGVNKYIKKENLKVYPIEKQL